MKLTLRVSCHVSCSERWRPIKIDSSWTDALCCQVRASTTRHLWEYSCRERSRRSHLSKAFFYCERGITLATYSTQLGRYGGGVCSVSSENSRRSSKIAALNCVVAGLEWSVCLEDFFSRSCFACLDCPSIGVIMACWNFQELGLEQIHFHLWAFHFCVST